MRTIIKSILLLVVFGATVAQVNAQNLKKKFSMGFGLEYGKINGDDTYKDHFKSFYGFNVRASVKAGPGFVTLSSGANYYPLDDDLTFEDPEGIVNIPIKLGYKLVVKPFFFHPEGGVALFRTLSYNDITDKTDITKFNGFNYAGTVGFHMGGVELGFRYQSTFNVKNSTNEFIKDNKLNGMSLVLNFNF